MLKQLGIVLYTSSTLALFAGLLIGIEPAVTGMNPGQTILAMSLFSQDTPVPQPIAKPKPAAAKSADTVAKAGPVVTGPLTPGTVNAPPTAAGMGPIAVPTPIVPGPLSAAPPAAASTVPRVPVSPEVCRSGLPLLMVRLLLMVTPMIPKAAGILSSPWPNY